MTDLPSPNGQNGRDELGRFSKGNAGGPGNPHARSVGAWRAALVDSVTDEDIRHVVGVLVEQAKAGERWAVVELLDRCLGKAPVEAPVDPEGLEIVVRHVHIEKTQ